MEREPYESSLRFFSIESRQQSRLFRKVILSFNLLRMNFKRSEKMDLREKLTSENVWHRFIDKPETVHTADASRASGVELNG